MGQHQPKEGSQGTGTPGSPTQLSTCSSPPAVDNIDKKISLHHPHDIPPNRRTPAGALLQQARHLCASFEAHLPTQEASGGGTES